MDSKKRKKKRKIKFQGILLIIFFLFLVSLFGYYLWTLPIKEVEIEGNTYLKDNYLISCLDLDNKSVLSVSRSKIKNKLKGLDLISDVKIKKNYFGKLKIIVKEEKVLFYNLNTKKVVLSNFEEVNYNENFLGVPVLINYVPEDILKEFKEKLNLIDREVLENVSEIEYSQSKIGEKIIDDKRFLFRMNDGNMVYINTINIKKFNNYLEIMDVIMKKYGDDVKGCLLLDSNSTNNHFVKNCEEVTGAPVEDNQNEE